MIFTENRQFQNTVSVHGSVKPACYAVGSPDTKNNLYFDTCNQKLEDNRKWVQNINYEFHITGS